MRFRAILLIFSLISFSGNAQKLVFSDDPATFGPELSRTLAGFQQPKLAARFDSAWSQYPADQQRQIVRLVQGMAAKNMKQPYLLPLAEAIAGGAGRLPAPTLVSFWATADTTLRRADSRGFLRMLEFGRAFLGAGNLYAGAFHHVPLSGGQLVFRYAPQPTDLQAGAEARPDTAFSAPKEPTDDGWGNGWTDDGWDTPPATPDTWAEAPQPRLLPAGPLLELRGATLSLVSKYDSLGVSGADGLLSIQPGLLLGTAGRVQWPGADTLRATVTLHDFAIETAKPILTAQKATLAYPARLDSTAGGVFRFESKPRSANTVASQPAFTSTQNNVDLKGLAPGISYRGGIGLYGNRLLSMGVNGGLATLTVRQGDTLAFRAQSRGFLLGDSLVTSPSARLTAYIGGRDSLFHPALRFRYAPRPQTLQVQRLERGGYQDAVFTDTYHSLYIRADLMRYLLPARKMEFDILGGQNAVPSRYESFDYFDPIFYDRITSQQGFHPVTILANALQKQNLTETTIGELAAFYKKDPKLIRSGMGLAIEKGFIDYDPATDVVRLSRRGRHYHEATFRRKDFDNMAMLSTYKGSPEYGNATLNLQDTVLTIRGVAPFNVSDSLKVFIMPGDKIVRVGHNRNLTFNGRMRLDNFNFAGQHLNFNYDKFYVNLDQIEQVTFVRQADKNKAGARAVGEDLKYTKGRLYLGRTNNKAGRQPNVPRLVVPDGVNVYFDDSTRLSGTYNRQVYFKIPKIDQDSLTSRDIDFAGVFESDGMLPPLKTKLVTMPDNSLGFTYQKNGEVLKLYGGKATLKLTGPMKMDSRGLLAEGTLSLLTTTLESATFLLTPDSLLTLSGTAGRIREGTVGKVFFPEVALKKYEMKWLPKEDSLIIRDRSGSIDLYSGSTRLAGELVLRSSGLYASGTLKRRDAEITSDQILFDKTRISARQSRMAVGPADSPVFLGHNMDVVYTIATGNTTIQMPAGLMPDDTTGLYFPNAGYRTSITKADFDANRKLISMKGDVRTSSFVSTNADQEGLHFNAAEAVYDLNKNQLNLSGVPFLTAADARILPDKNQLIIGKDGQVQPLSNAIIVADTLNAYHRLVQGNLRVLSARRFEGDARYAYGRAKGDTTLIKMDAFRLAEVPLTDRPQPRPGRRRSRNETPVGYATQADARLEEQDGFLLTPNMQFRGEATLRATEPGLAFRGAIRPALKWLETGWVAFTGRNGDSLRIEVKPGLKSEGQGLPLTAGLHAGGNTPYLTFLSAKDNPTDADWFTATGLLREVPGGSGRQLEVIAENRMHNGLEGPRMVLDDARRTVSYDGPLGLVQPVSAVAAAGSARIVPDSARYSFNAMLALNTPLPAQAAAAAATKIVQTNLDERLSDEPAEPDFDRLLFKIANVGGEKSAETFRSKSSNGASVPLSSLGGAFARTAILSDVSLRYAPDHTAFYSVGKIGVGSLGGTEVNGRFGGAVEIRKNTGSQGDDFFCLLQPTADLWYYFAYVQGQWGMVSSDAGFNSQVAGKKGGAVLVSEEDRLAFLERFEATYKVSALNRPTARRTAPPARRVTDGPALTPPAAKTPAAEPKAAAAADSLKISLPKALAKTDSLTLKAKADSVLTAARPALTDSTQRPRTVPNSKPAKKRTGF